MRQNSACLASLEGFQQRVLELRAGFGGQSPRSRRGVARRLHVPVDRVARAESRGLVRLRLAVGSGACGVFGTIGSPGSIPPLLPPAMAAPMPELTRLASLSPGSESDGPGGSGAVLGLTRSGGDGESEADSGAGGDVVAARVGADAGDGLSALPILLAGLVLLALIGAFALLRSRRTPVAQGDPSPAERVPPASVVHDPAPAPASVVREPEPAPALPVRDPAPRPEPEARPERFAPGTPAPGSPARSSTSPTRRRGARAAGIAASAIGSVAARALVQRRRRSRRRWRL